MDLNEHIVRLKQDRQEALEIATRLELAIQNLEQRAIPQVVPAQPRKRPGRKPGLKAKAPAPVVRLRKDGQPRQKPGRKPGQKQAATRTVETEHVAAE